MTRSKTKAAKKPAPTASRTTISLPPRLKARLDAAGAALNVSGLAAQALEAALDELDAKTDAKGLDAVVLRLRASKRRSADANTKQAFAAGERWVSHLAEESELRALEEAWADPTRDRFLDDSWPGKKAPIAAIILLQWLREEPDLDAESARAFWRAVAPGEVDDLPADTFVRAFAEGALDLWARVKDRL